MGAGQSINQIVSNNLSFTDSTNIMSSAAASASTGQTYVSNINVTIQAKYIEAGNFNIANLANISSQVYAGVASELTLQQVREIAQSVQSDVAAALSKTAEDIGGIIQAFGGKQNLNQEINNAIATCLDTTVNINSITSVWANLDATQNTTITIGGPLCDYFYLNDFVVNSNFQSELAARSLTSSLLQATLDTQAGQDLVNRATATVSNETTGFASLLSKLLETLLIPVIAFVVIIGAVLIVRQVLKSQGNKTIVAQQPVQLPPQPAPSFSTPPGSQGSPYYSPQSFPGGSFR